MTLFILALLCWTFVWGGLGYEIGRHKKCDEAFREGQLDAFDRGQRLVAHMREHERLADRER